MFFFSFSILHRCTMRVFEPVALVVDCPVDTLFAGQSLFVMEVAGEVGEALLMSTSLGCGDSLNVSVERPTVYDDSLYHYDKPDHSGINITFVLYSLFLIIHFRRCNTAHIIDTRSNHFDKLSKLPITNAAV